MVSNLSAPQALAMKKSLARSLAGTIANSPFLHRGRTLWEQNENNFKFPLNRNQKAWAGAYLVLSHFAQGKFPPTFVDQQKFYENERSTRTRAGMDDSEAREQGRRKPFWFNQQGPNYMRHFAFLMESFQKLGICPPAKVLEIGCGGGWASNFLAQMDFQVVGTTIYPQDVEDAQSNAEAYRIQNPGNRAKFVAVPMEQVHQATLDLGPFDAAFVYEALHHAYDWRIACEQVYKSLKPGGWFLLCNEPNMMHTIIAYRHSVMAHSPEIGFNKRKLFRALEEIGFKKRVVLANRFGFYTKPFWIAVQR